MNVPCFLPHARTQWVPLILLRHPPSLGWTEPPPGVLGCRQPCQRCPKPSSLPLISPTTLVLTPSLSSGDCTTKNASSWSSLTISNSTHSSNMPPSSLTSHKYRCRRTRANQRPVAAKSSKHHRRIVQQAPPLLLHQESRRSMPLPSRSSQVADVEAPLQEPHRTSRRNPKPLPPLLCPLTPTRPHSPLANDSARSTADLAKPTDPTKPKSD